MSYTLRLKELRKAAGLTQRDICDQTGIKLGTYRAWEQGVSQLRLDDAFLLAKALGCDPNDIAGWYDTHPKPRYESLTQQEHALISDFRACSADDRLLIPMTARNAAELRKSEVESAPPEGMEGDRRRAV